MLPILIRVPAETAVRTEDVGIFARWQGEPTETRESKNESKAEDVQPGSSEFDHWSEKGVNSSGSIGSETTTSLIHSYDETPWLLLAHWGYLLQLLYTKSEAVHLKFTFNVLSL